MTAAQASFPCYAPRPFSSPRCVLFPIKCYRLRPWSVPFFRIYKKVWIYNVFRIQSRSDETIRNRWVEAKRFPHPVTCLSHQLEITPRSPPRFARRLAPPNLMVYLQHVGMLTSQVNDHIFLQEGNPILDILTQEEAELLVDSKVEGIQIWVMKKSIVGRRGPLGRGLHIQVF